MPLADRSMWVRALATNRSEAISSVLADDVELRDLERVITGRGPVAEALSDWIGTDTDDLQVIELGDPSLIAVRRRGAAAGDQVCLILSAEFDSQGLIMAVAVRDVPAPVVQIGIEESNRGPADLLGAESRDLADGITLRSFASAKRVTKRWGSETWLHADSHSFGFKVIRLRAGCRTSLQYHEKKEEVYFVLDGLARLHYRNDTGAVVTAPFLQGTVAMVQPLAWHRVEAITDVTLIEASTYDDGSDNVRLEDDYGRQSGYVEAEHEL